jgi:hypothetical protein
MIIMIVLVALAVVVSVRVFGTRLRTSYDCTSQSVASGKGLPEGCTGTDAGKKADAAARDLNLPAPLLKRILAALGFSRFPQPAPAQGPGNAPPLTPAQSAFADARSKLEKIPAGKQFLDFLDKNNVTVEFQTGPGGSYDKTNKKIVLGEPYTADELLLSFLHEGNHAIFDIDGKTADAEPITMSREDYIARMIEEEVVGTVLPIEMAKELAKAGHPVIATFPLEREYYAAYTKATQDLQQANPNATPAELDSAGRQAGFEAVKAGFENGTVISSVRSNGTFETYPDFYGHRWDSKVLGAGVP